MKPRSPIIYCIPQCSCVPCIFFSICSTEFGCLLREQHVCATPVQLIRYHIKCDTKTWNTTGIVKRIGSKIRIPLLNCNFGYPMLVLGVERRKITYSRPNSRLSYCKIGPCILFNAFTTSMTTGSLCLLSCNMNWNTRCEQSFPYPDAGNTSLVPAICVI